MAPPTVLLRRPLLESRLPRNRRHVLADAAILLLDPRWRPETPAGIFASSNRYDP